MFDIFKKSVKYTRVSTNKQDDRGSKEIQDLRIDEFAKQNNYEIIASFTDTDHGDNPNRPGLYEMKKYLQINSDVKFVICLFVDRFSRSAREAIENLYLFQDLGVTLITVNEGEMKLDGTFKSITPLIHLLNAEEEKTKIVKKTTDSMYNYALNSNRFLGGSLLPWFKKERGSLHGIRCNLIVKNEETWDYYRYIFLEMIKHKSLKIVSEKEKIPYPTLREWIAKPELRGYRTFGKKGKMINYKKGRRKNYQISTEKVLPAILTDDEFEKIQIMYRRFKFQLERKYPYLFTRVSFCECGAKLGGNSFNKKSGTLMAYYRCYDCGKRFNAKRLEKILIEKLINDDTLKMLNDYEFRIADMIDEKNKKQKEIFNLRNKENDILDLITDGLLSKDTAREKLKELKKSISIIERKINEIENNIEIEKTKEITNDILESFKFLLKNYDEDTLDELQQILNLILKKIIVYSYENIKIIY